jgi:transposase InsO family protein
MPWKELSIVSNRNEFVRLACAEGANVRQLCRRFGVSPTTAYKWIQRYRVQGADGLIDRPRTPHNSPEKTPEGVEAAVLELRDRHPAWGGRKLRARLQALGHTDVPAASTITAILRRHDRLGPPARPTRNTQRFEHPTPNALWQMDFKGHFATGAGRCHPLTVLDDHARYSLGLFACADQTNRTVRGHLTEVFRRFGLPERILCDNGMPWGSVESAYTRLGVWLLRLGVGVCHGRPYHPQTQGKDERFHRTLSVEVLQGQSFPDLGACQRRFDAWREVYNAQRPHEALGLDVPSSRYRVSPRPFPEVLPAIEYHEHDEVRRVQVDGRVYWRDRPWRVGKAFAKQQVAIRPTTEDGRFDIYFATIAVARIDLRGNND